MMILAREHHGSRVAEPITSDVMCSMDVCGLQEYRVRPDNGEVAPTVRVQREATDGSDHPGHFLLLWSQRVFKSWTTTVFTSPARCCPNVDLIGQIVQGLYRGHAHHESRGAPGELMAWR